MADARDVLGTERVIRWWSVCFQDERPVGLWTVDFKSKENKIVSLNDNIYSLYYS